MIWTKLCSYEEPSLVRFGFRILRRDVVLSFSVGVGEA